MYGRRKYFLHCQAFRAGRVAASKGGSARRQETLWCQIYLCETACAQHFVMSLLAACEIDFCFHPPDYRQQ